jgi:hypothetical protein
MIQEITPTEVVQRCAKCDRENHITRAELQVGVERGGVQVEDSVFALPTCPTCLSQEFLVRSPAEEPYPTSDGSLGHLHRLLVDELHAGLVKEGRVAGRLKEQAGIIFTRPIDDKAREAFFPNGLKLPAQAVEKIDGEEPKR